LILLPFQSRVPIPWHLSPQVLGWYAALILLSTISGFGLYTTGLRYLQASVAAIAASTEVAFAAMVAYIALGERLDAWQILGVILVVGGVILLSWPRARLQGVVAGKRHLRDA
jgi:drug/metabolite transporter (DMT)-like permease